MRRGQLVRIVVATAIANCACSGGPDRLSRDAFIERGDELCAGYNQTSARLLVQINDEDSQAQGAATLAAAAPVLTELAAALADHARELDRLVAPKDAEAAFMAALVVLRRGADALAEAAAGAAAGDLDRAQRSFEVYSEATDAAGAWAATYGFRSCGRRDALEETEQADVEGPPLAPEELEKFCTELDHFVGALAKLSPRTTPDELESELVDLGVQAAALADLPPPGAGSALAEARATLKAVTKEAAELDFDLGAGGTDSVLAPLASASATLEVRVFGLGACSGQ